MLVLIAYVIQNLWPCRFPGWLDYGKILNDVE